MQILIKSSVASTHIQAICAIICQRKNTINKRRFLNYKFSMLHFKERTIQTRFQWKTSISFAKVLVTNLLWRMSAERSLSLCQLRNVLSSTKASNKVWFSVLFSLAFSSGKFVIRICFPLWQQKGTANFFLHCSAPSISIYL